MVKIYKLYSFMNDLCSQKMETSENRTESTNQLSESEQDILNFLDSMDSYLILMDSLSSALRQGWLDLASARHSMGASRVSSALFDLKSHHASTTLQAHNGPDVEFAHFTLCKWAPSNDSEKCSDGAKFEDDELLQKKSNSPRLQHHELQGDTADDGGSPVTIGNQAQKERLKSLSVFGALVSPMLWSTQLSFEKALEMLVEISNVRASLLYAYDQLQKDLKNIKE